MRNRWTVVEDKDWLGNPTLKVEKKEMLFDDEREELDYKISFAENGLREYMKKHGFTEEEISLFDDATEKLIQLLMKRLSRMLRNA